MNANDIFKQLMVGTKFAREHNPRRSGISEPIVVKTEKEEDVREIPQKEKQDTITLLTTLGSNGTGKKRKHSDPQNDEIKKKKLKQEEVNHYRNVNKISVVGKQVPEPARKFDDFPVEELIISRLKGSGYVEPTPIQQQTVPIMLEGRNLLACAPTGSGKTAAFLVPIIHHLKEPGSKGFRALILCPTRELAKQTQAVCLRLSEGKGFRVHIMSKINRALTQYGPKSSQKFDILITTPNRLCFLLKQDPPAISLANIEWLVFDEADKLFETGNRGFREQVDEILLACTNKERKIAMFGATCTPVVIKWCVHNMKRLVRVTVGHRNAATDSVHQELLWVGNEQGKLIAIRDLIRKGISPPILIFVQSKDRAQQLFNELVYDEIHVDAIHADRTQTQRDNTVKSFLEGKTWVLICTELMARGIDFIGVNLVINYDFPLSTISYVHRVGRAGRAGRKGKAITFFTKEDIPNLRGIAHVVKDSGGEIPPYMLTLKKNKREKKQLVRAAPKREEISVRPKYELVKKIKRRQKDGSNKKKSNLLEKRKFKNQNPKNVLTHKNKIEENKAEKKVKKVKSGKKKSNQDS